MNVDRRWIENGWIERGYRVDYEWIEGGWIADKGQDRIMSTHEFMR